LLREGSQAPKRLQHESLVSLRVQQRDLTGAAELARTVMSEWLPPATGSHAVQNELRSQALHQELVGFYWATANALRDEAIQTGNFASAVDLIERSVQLFSGSSLMRNRGLLLTYAHVLLLSGETRRGREVLTAMLQQLDAEQIGRPPHIYAWERAAIFAMLGEDERAIDELALSQKMGRYVGWQYMAEHDPIYSRVRRDPRFQALVAQARAHSDQQRALLNEMRRKGEVPTRS
jgi:hypothetical protein